MDPNADVHEHISKLNEEQRQIRSGDLPHDQARLAELEREIDQAWDLLRQREALREAGENPREAHERGQSTVEGYQQ